MRVSVNVMKWVLPAAMLATSGIAYAQLTNPQVVCPAASRTPEAHAFYGDANALVRKVNAVNLPIQDRRLYLYTLETNKGAELAVFERVNDGSQFKVSTWKGASVGDLKERLNEAMMTNQGKHCIGKKSTDLINAKFDLTPAGYRAPPRSAGELVPVDAQLLQGDFARITFFLLC